jgi:histone H3/H4
MTTINKIKINLDKLLKEIIPKNTKITREVIDLIKIICKEFIENLSQNSSLLYLISSKHLLTQEDISKIIAKSGLGRYIIEIDEELKKYTKEELELKKFSK